VPIAGSIEHFLLGAPSHAATVAVADRLSVLLDAEPAWDGGGGRASERKEADRDDSQQPLPWTVGRITVPAAALAAAVAEAQVQQAERAAVEAALGAMSPAALESLASGGPASPKPTSARRGSEMDRTAPTGSPASVRPGSSAGRSSPGGAGSSVVKSAAKR
jgi:hypothetical protein